MKIVLDASAILALLNEEPGAARVRDLLHGAAMSAVNFVEVGTRLLDLGENLAAVEQALKLLGIEIVAFDTGLAASAIGLREQTRRYGLSVGDRACLALAIRSGATAITADRAWADLKIGCEIEVIR